MIHIVLVEPEIPQNTGNIVRSVAATATKLHIVKPTGFSMEDKYLRRAGLDYWDMSDIEIHESFAEYWAKYGDKPTYFASTKAIHRYDEVAYEDECFILFGKETKGLDEQLLHDHYDRAIRIPMREGCRSLNLSNSVAIVLYEALRQRDFDNLKTAGALTRHFED